MVLNAGAGQIDRIVEIAAIEHHARLEHLAQTVEIGAPKLLPLGDDHQRIGVAQRVDSAACVLDPCIVAERTLGLVDGYRIVGTDGRPALEQIGHQHAARRLAHVIGVGFKSQPPQRESLAGETLAEAAHDLARQHLFLLIVDAIDRRKNLQTHARMLAGVHQRLHILGEARAAVTDARVQEIETDARIGADAAAHVLDVGPQPLGQIRQLVHERNARGEHRVGRVLGEFGRAHIHLEDLVVVALERRVERTHDAERLCVVGADDDAIGSHEIVDRSPFLEELGVGDHRVLHIELALAQFVADRRAHRVGGTDRHGGFVDHEPVRGHVTADRAGGIDHVTQIGRAVFLRWRAHRDELHQSMLDAFGHVGGEVQAPRGTIALDHLLQPRLVDRDAAVVEDAHLALVHIETHHVVADLREAGPGHQADVTTADHRYAHESLSIKLAGRFQPTLPAYCPSSNSSVRRGGYVSQPLQAGHCQ